MATRKMRVLRGICVDYDFTLHLTRDWEILKWWGLKNKVEGIIFIPVSDHVMTAWMIENLPVIGTECVFCRGWTQIHLYFNEFATFLSDDEP